MPEIHFAVAQLTVGKLQHDAADVGVGEEVVSRELKVVQGAACVEEEWVAAPAGEEAVLTGLRHLSVCAGRYRSTFDDRLPVVAAAGALDAYDRRTLRAVI